MPTASNGATVRIKDLTQHQIIPVVVINSATQAQGLGEALEKGGIPIAEVTFRTAAATKSIEILSQNPNLIVGAGTILNPNQVKQAADAGASFIVSPGFNPKVVETALNLDLLVLPGGVTPTEITSIIEMGLKTIKFFPANIYGGVAAIKALSAPFTGINFVPTGGINPTNINDYLALPCIPAVGGSWMVPNKLIDEGDFLGIEKLVAEAGAGLKNNLFKN